MIIYYNKTKHTKTHGQDFSHDDFYKKSNQANLFLKSNGQAEGKNCNFW